MDILNELKEAASPLAVTPFATPFTVPDGYFDNLAQTLVNGVLYSEAADPVLSLPRAMPFSVPASYFESIAESVHKPSESHLQTGIATPFALPDNYFESLPESLTAAASAGKSLRKGKVISFRPQWYRVGRIAAAAILVLGLGLGTYRYLQPTGADAVASKQLSKLDKESIGFYVEAHVDEFDAETLENALVSVQADPHSDISTLDAAEIQEYLQETGDVTPEEMKTETL